jgi:membrane protein YdbS with pleckstrin-like domain
VTETPEADREAPVAKQTPPPQRKLVAEMLAEWLREASVLVMVFGWLDRAVRGEPFWSTGWALVVIGLAVGALASGVALERVRRKEWFVNVNSDILPLAIGIGLVAAFGFIWVAVERYVDARRARKSGPSRSPGGGTRT